jgi:hypothetical protein
MRNRELGKRLRLSLETESALEQKLKEEGRRSDLSPFVDEICTQFLNNELLRIRPDMLKRLIAKRASLKRREDLGPFVEWICELYLDQEGEGSSGIVEAAGAEKLKEKEKDNDQRKAS